MKSSTAIIDELEARALADGRAWFVSGRVVVLATLKQGRVRWRIDCKTVTRAQLITLLDAARRQP
jgi:hypothetical protein